jgi:DNA invertase Pin-like site-specific DNA recombinase
MPPKKGYQYPKTRWSADRVVLLFLHGESQSAIARAVGLHRSTVRRILMRVQLRPR